MIFDLALSFGDVDDDLFLLLSDLQVVLLQLIKLLLDALLFFFGISDLLLQLVDLLNGVLVLHHFLYTLCSQLLYFVARFSDDVGQLVVLLDLVVKIYK